MHSETLVKRSDIGPGWVRVLPPGAVGHESAVGYEAGDLDIPPDPREIGRLASELAGANTAAVESAERWLADDSGEAIRSALDDARTLWTERQGLVERLQSLNSGEQGRAQLRAELDKIIRETGELAAKKDEYKSLDIEMQAATRERIKQVGRQQEPVRLLKIANLLAWQDNVTRLSNQDWFHYIETLPKEDQRSLESDYKASRELWEQSYGFNVAGYGGDGAQSTTTYYEALSSIKQQLIQLAYKPGEDNPELGYNPTTKRFIADEPPQSALTDGEPGRMGDQADDLGFLQITDRLRKKIDEADREISEREELERALSSQMASLSIQIERQSESLPSQMRKCAELKALLTEIDSRELRIRQRIYGVDGKIAARLQELEQAEEDTDSANMARLRSMLEDLSGTEVPDKAAELLIETMRKKSLEAKQARREGGGSR